MNNMCTYCGSFNFQDETVRSCCHNGKVDLDLFKNTPPELIQMFTGTNEDAKNFQTYIRNYNAANSFAGMNCTLDPLTNQAGQCIFKVNGEVTHVISKHLHPAPNERHQYSQLFMLDSSTAVAINIRQTKTAKKM